MADQKSKGCNRTLGKNIQEYREAIFLSQDELAERVKVSVDFIRRIEEKKLYPSVRKIKDIADVLKVTMGDLYDGDVFLDDSKDLAKNFDIEMIIRTLNRLAGLPEDDREGEDDGDDWWKK